MKTRQRTAQGSLLLALLLILSIVSTMPVAGQESTPCDAGFRLFDHEYLATEPVCIPENPQKVVVAWAFNVTALLRADVPIIGTNSIEFNQGQFPEWTDDLGQITDVGRPINLEVILGLSPDLIITSDFDAEGNEDALSSIAPTVLFTWEGTHVWRDVAQLMFDAAGRLKEYDALMIEQETRAAELGTLIDDPQAVELSIVNVRADRILLYTQYSPGGMIVEEVGFSRPEVQLWPDAESPAYLREISFEELQQADGDYILIFGGFALDEDAQVTLDELLESPLWQSLGAVQADRVYISNVNFAGGDIGNAHAMLDELAAAFGVADDFSPNPYITRAEIPARAPEATEEAAG